MNWLIKLLKPVIKKQAIKYLRDNQEKWVDLINEKLDIPNMDEAAEQEMLNKQYDLIETILGDVVEEF